MRLWLQLLVAILCVLNLSACGNKGKLKSPAQIEVQKEKELRKEEKKKKSAEKEAAKAAAKKQKEFNAATPPVAPVEEKK